MPLFLIGSVLIDTFPLSADGVDRETGADYAEKELLGRLKGREFVGEGDEVITLKGKILPHNLLMNGLPMLNVLHGLRKAGEPVMVMRGTGTVMGWFVVTSVKESHTFLDPMGVGQVIDHEIKITKVLGPGVNDGFSLLSSLISLFTPSSSGAAPQNDGNLGDNQLVKDAFDAPVPTTGSTGGGGRPSGGTGTAP